MNSSSWIGSKHRIVKIPPSWQMLQVAEVHIGKNLRTVLLCSATRFFPFLVLYHSYRHSYREKNCSSTELQQWEKKEHHQDTNTEGYDILEGINKIGSYFQGLKKWHSRFCCIYILFPWFFLRTLGLNALYNWSVIYNINTRNRRLEYRRMLTEEGIMLFWRVMTILTSLIPGLKNWIHCKFVFSRNDLLTSKNKLFFFFKGFTLMKTVPFPVDTLQWHSSCLILLTVHLPTSDAALYC